MFIVQYVTHSCETKKTADIFANLFEQGNYVVVVAAIWRIDFLHFFF